MQLRKAFGVRLGLGKKRGKKRKISVVSDIALCSDPEAAGESWVFGTDQK